MAHIISSGESSEGIILEYGGAFLSMIVYDGGTANSTTVNSSGSLIVSSGGTANNTTVNSEGCLFVRNGGTANNTTLNACHYLMVSKGGTANNTTVNSGGWLIVSSGGTATEIIENGGCVNLKEGASASFLNNSFSGLVLSNYQSATLHSGTTANNTTVYFGGGLNIFSGGTANDTLNAGSLNVSNGGTANNTTVKEGGWLIVSSGGTANNTTLNSSGYILISSGGTANNTTVKEGGWLGVSSGGTANSTTLNSGGTMGIASGGTATNVIAVKGAAFRITVASNTYIQGSWDDRAFEMKDALISGFTVNDGADLAVSSGGTANNTTVDSGGSLNVFSGGTATEIIENGGDVYVEDGAEVLFTPNTISGMRLTSAHTTVHSATTANGTTVNFIGYLTVSNGGTANDTTVNSGGYVFISNGGTANDTTVNSGGYVIISSGGTANHTTVNSDGSMFVSSGGTANGITLNSGCHLNLSSGGTANGITLNSGCYLNLSSGGTANSTTVNSGGWVYVSDEGTANRITVNSGGKISIAGDDFYISGGHIVLTQGGTATEIMENGGFVDASEGAAVSFLENSFSGLILSGASATVHSGTTANSTTIESGGYLIIFNGGTADSTTLNAGGSLCVSSGVTANGTTVNSGGGFFVYSSGTANSTTVNSGGSFFVYSSGTANSTTVNSSGDLYCYGTANSITVNSGGYVGAFNGGTADFTTVSGGSLAVYNGGTADFTTVSGGSLTVYNGGTLHSTTVNSGGKIIVSSGATATGIIASGGAFLDLTLAPDTYIQGTSDGSAFEFKNALLSGYTVNSNVWIHVSSGAMANSVTINSNGRFAVFSDGMADVTTVNGGRLYIYSGGTTNNTTVFSSGSRDSTTANFLGQITVFDGGTANSTTVESGGCMVFYNGGMANSVMINSSGHISLESGATVNSTMVNGGELYIFGGTANNTTVKEGGVIFVSSGGTAYSVIVSSASEVTIAQGGKLSGQITVERGAGIILQQNAVLDFDLTQTFPGESALVNNFSRMNGNPFYTLTIRGENQPAGIYQLARNVYEFNKTISVMDVSGITFGKLSVGQTVSINNMSYAMSMDSGSLFLSIREPGPDTIAPAVFNVQQSHSAPTLRPVTVTAAFADDVELKSKLYRLGEDGAWTDYSGGVTLTENATVYFKAVDTSGNESEVVCHTVTNIDKKALDPVYVYLDFDGEETSYNNRDLNLSFAVTVANPDYTDSRKESILAELVDKYAANGIIFTLTRPENTEYSTLYFGKSDTFADYGEYFGISETVDHCNQIKDDNAFVLLDSTYSTAQTISVAESALDHILGYTCSPKDELQLRDYAVNSYLLSTEWHQEEPYNIYCPVDPETGLRFSTGCTNTAAAQIIYYWIENGILDFSLSLDDLDYAYIGPYTTKTLLDADSLTAEQYGYLSFEEINEILSNFKLDDEDSIAALNLAAGFVQGAVYASDGTATSFNRKLFTRSGFQNSLKSYYYLNSYDSFILDKDALGLTDIGLEILIQDLLAGHPVAVTVPDHAIVIDGYDSATGDFHINFGWGGMRNGWYSPDSGLMKAIDGIIVGITPETNPVLSVSGLSFEQDAVKQGKDVVVNVSMSNSGKVKSSEAIAYVYAGDTLLSSQVLDFLYPGETRVFSLLVDSSGLSLGENAITVKVDSPDAEELLSTSQTIELLENVVLNARCFTGDFDGNGCDTLAVQSGSTVTIYQNGEPWGDGLTLDPGWDILGTGDFNGDNLDDFLRVHSSGLVVGEISDGYGGFNPQVLNFRNEGWDILGTGDFDGDGADDVLIANPTAASETVGLLGYWKGGTEWTLINGYSPKWTMVSTGDFDGDGKCDMLWKNEFIGEGGLTYNAYCTWIVEDPVDWRMVSVANPDEWNFLCSGDFDGNGSHDIAMINDVGVMGIWGVTDGYLSSWSILSAVTSEWTLAGVADFNADGTDDIAWSNTDTGLVGYWQINNKELTTWANIVTLG